MTKLKRIAADDLYRYSGYGHNIYTFVGNFVQKSSVNHSEYYLHYLDSMQKEYFANFKLKPSEVILRCETDKSRLTGLHFFVKINLTKLIVYYPVSDQNDENIRFEKLGIKMAYLNLLDTIIDSSYEHQN